MMLNKWLLVVTLMVAPTAIISSGMYSSAYYVCLFKYPNTQDNLPHVGHVLGRRRRCEHNITPAYGQRSLRYIMFTWRFNQMFNVFSQLTNLTLCGTGNSSGKRILYEIKINTQSY